MTREGVSCFWRLQAAIPFADPSRGQGSLRSFRFFFLLIFFFFFSFLLFSFLFFFFFFDLSQGGLTFSPLCFFPLCFGLQRASCCSPYRTIRAVHDSTSLCSLCSLLVMSLCVAGSRRLRWAAVWSLGSFPPRPPVSSSDMSVSHLLGMPLLSSCLLLLFIIVRDILRTRKKNNNNNNKQDHDIKTRRRGT